MVGLNRKLCVFGSVANFASLIFAMLVAPVESDDDGVVSSFSKTWGARMMQGNMMHDLAAASVSAPKNRELVRDHHTSYNCQMPILVSYSHMTTHLLTLPPHRCGSIDHWRYHTRKIGLGDKTSLPCYSGGYEL